MLTRPIYDDDHYFAWRDVLGQQQYLLERLRRRNRCLHGWGIVCGLHVVSGNDLSRPWAIRVCPGYALDPCGNEISVTGSIQVDIRDYLWLRPITNGLPAPMAYVAIKYVEEPARPVPVSDPLCGCQEPRYEASRIRDGFQVDILWKLPRIADNGTFDFCPGNTPPCPEPPTGPYVFLASVHLPANEAHPIMAAQIHKQ